MVTESELSAISLIAHELRTPLAANKAFVDTVLLQWDRLDDPKKQEMLQRASNNASELNWLIEQLLDYSRVESDSLVPHLTEFSFEDLLAEVLRELDSYLSTHQVIEVVQINDPVNADRDMMKRILVNLLSNAKKYSEPGTEILVSASSASGKFRMSVKDNGIGMDSDEAAQVFEKFYRANRSAARGTGIGMSIVKAFAESQGATVDCETELGVGTTFILTMGD